LADLFPSSRSCPAVLEIEDVPSDITPQMDVEALQNMLRQMASGSGKALTDGTEIPGNILHER